MQLGVEYKRMYVEKIAKNSYYAFAAQATTVILKAITQVVFVHTLAAEYLGINGLFSNILTMLSLAEMGVGTAILFNLYEPVAINDVIRIKKLMNFYKSVYTKIGLFVLVTGISLTPFLKVFIKDQPDISNLKLIYILYVLNNAISYFYVYKQSILIANQENYVIFQIEIFKAIFMNLIQIFLLVSTKTFLPFLITSIVVTVIGNFACSIIAEKKYPYIKDNNETLMKSEKQKIYKDIYATMAHKVGGVIVMGTDNLLISTFVGIAAVGYYSNYLLIISSIRGFMTKVYDSLVSSIGSLINTACNKNDIFEAYKNLLFVSFWITSIFCIGFSCLANPMIKLLFGEQYVLSKPLVVLMAVNFYFTDLAGIRAITNKFKAAQGLFWNDRYKPYIESIINLVVSILLLKLVGFAGVLLGTLISTICTGFWVEPLVLFKYGFQKKLGEYFKLWIPYTCLFFFSWFLLELLTSWIEGFISIFLGGIMCVILPSFFYYFFFRNRNELNYVIQLFKKLYEKIKIKFVGIW